VNLPNALTLARLILIPVFIIIYYLPLAWAHAAAAIIFAIASLTDWLDGYLARKWHQMSTFGAFLDPVADKLLVTSSLLILVGEYNLHYITLPAIIIVGREIVISALREWMAELGRRASIAVNFVAKVKTAMQMTAIALLLAYSSYTSWWGLLGVLLLYVAAILTLWSMGIYFLMTWRELSKKVDATS
jgi:CDP-diacylglycerol--glycerol-3-phosphate 3-phosphatidyltransferase